MAEVGDYKSSKIAIVDIPEFAIHFACRRETRKIIDGTVKVQGHTGTCKWPPVQLVVMNNGSEANSSRQKKRNYVLQPRILHLKGRLGREINNPFSPNQNSGLL